MAYKQQKFISHSPRGWEFQDQDAGSFHVRWEPAYWLTDSNFWLCSHMVEGSKGDFWGLYKVINLKKKVINLIHEGFTLMT